MDKSKYSKIVRIGIFISICCLYYMVFIRISNFSDDAFFGGDTWEYQSMAVNFATGHGIQKFGAMEPFEKYKFAKMEELPAYYNTFVTESGWDDFYRTPAYPLFLGIIYKIFGISPLIAKKIQLILLVIVAASLPWIGQYFWKTSGWLCGLISGPVYLYSNFLFAQLILAEAFCVFTVFLIVISYINYDRNKSILSVSILGLITGIGLLVKGTMVFMPLMFIVYFLISFFKSRQKEYLKHLLFYIIFSIATILPWSVYASVKANETIILSRQVDSVLLGYNNEFSQDGYWHPEYKNDEKSFYFNDGIEMEKTARKVLNFYKHHPSAFLHSMLNKLKNGFSSFLFLTISMVIFIMLKIGKRIEMTLTEKYLAVYYSLSVIVFSFLLIGGIKHTFLSTETINSLTVSSTYFLWLFALVVLAAIFGPGIELKVPSGFLIIFSGLLLVTLAIGLDDAVFSVEKIVYKSRFVKVMDFIFILTGIIFIKELLSVSYSKILSSLKLHGNF